MRQFPERRFEEPRHGRGFFVDEEWRSDFTHISMKLESRELMLDLIARGIKPVPHLAMRDSWSPRLRPGMLEPAFSVKN